MTKTLEDYTKDELIDIIKGLKQRKKFGLVWEEKPEEIVRLCETELPVLEEITGRAITENQDGPTNLIIEGDNYHSLSILNYTHSGKVDAIYADPPYNTGAKNWVYNNNFVDGSDTYRHSKWLSFMGKRLKLAKSLLKDDGIIVVTIDDYEIATLTLLMNEIFGEENHLGTVVIKNNPQGRSSVSGFQVSHEYALFYSKSQKAKIGRLPRTQEQIDRYKETDDKGPFEWRNFRAQYSTESPKMKYPIFAKKDCSDFRLPKMEWNTDKQSYDLLEDPDVSEIVSIPTDSNGRERTWKWSIETVEAVKKTEMGVRLDKDKKPSVYYKGRIKEQGMLPYTIWDKSDYSASSMGANLLSSILGKKKFDYPKSLYAVIDSLRVLSSSKDALFLDFFAGSGTTGHAVLEMNKKDNGNRRFILCTNNENGIAEEVTYQRIKGVIEGYGKTEGVPANARYFKTGLVSKKQTDDQTRIELVARSTDMICVREDTFDKVLDTKYYKVFGNSDHYSAIVFEPDVIPLLKDALTKLDDEKPIHIYVFSLSNDTYESDFADLQRLHELRPIPESILEVYRRIFKDQNVSIGA